MSDSLDPIDCSLSGSSVYGILQARILEWVAISFSSQFCTSPEKNLRSLFLFLLFGSIYIKLSLSILKSFVRHFSTILWVCSFFFFFPVNIAKKIHWIYYLLIYLSFHFFMSSFANLLFLEFHHCYVLYFLVIFLCLCWSLFIISLYH